MITKEHLLYAAVQMTDSGCALVRLASAMEIPVGRESNYSRGLLDVAQEAGFSKQESYGVMCGWDEYNTPGTYSPMREYRIQGGAEDFDRGVRTGKQARKFAGGKL